MGNFAQQSLPLDDSVALTIQRVNHTVPETVIVGCSSSFVCFFPDFIKKLPYRSRLGPTAVPFNDTNSYRANNCVALTGTNGQDLYASSTDQIDPSDKPIAKFQQQPPISPDVARKHPVNVMLDTSPVSDVVLPPELQPGLSPVSGSRNAAQFYMLKDGKTGVLALGSFSDNDFFGLQNSLLQGILSLKSQNATQLVVDVVGPQCNPANRFIDLLSVT
jgi:hypothetical protein